ncbi:hypothetical protein OpiT1DRAFT_05273 [Opitutaceae bacterium TAV1]|nr:hypothetical protein OpiT1DRAFT_05273 [Opitutaceae bacterium TAV1]
MSDAIRERIKQQRRWQTHMERKHPGQSFAALVRGDDGGLHVRSFPSAQEAATASAPAREAAGGAPDLRMSCSASLAAPHPEAGTAGTSPRGWRPSRLARELGVSKRTVSRRCEANELPFIDHGGGKRPYRIIPMHVVKLVKLYGLGGVARMRAAGQL